MGYNVGITLAGYYNEDEEILSKINLPEGLDKDILTYQILTDVGNLYPAIQEPTILKKAIHNWFDSNYHNFERILLAINADYSPIENYDRTEEHIITRKGNETESGSNQSNRNETNQTDSNGSMNETTNGNSNSTSITSTEGNETDQRAADNSESFRNTNKRISEAESSGTDSGTTSAVTNGTNSNLTNASLTGNDSGSFQTGRDRSENETEMIRAHGNIGTTRNSEMVFDEIELRKYNIYEDIVSRFADKFLICVF